MGYKNKKYQLYDETDSSSQYSTKFKQKKTGLPATGKHPSKLSSGVRERNNSNQTRNTIRDRQRKLKYQHSLQDDISMLSLQPSASNHSISSHTPTRTRGSSSAYATPTKPKPVTTNSPFNTTIAPGTLTPLKATPSTTSLASSFSTSTLNTTLSPRTKSNVQNSVISYLFTILFPSDQNHNIPHFQLPTSAPPIPAAGEQYDHFYDDDEDDDSVISITPVDGKWFHQLLLTHFLADYESSGHASAFILQESTKAIPENATVSALLEDFLPPFITNMVFAIYFDNNYIVSPKVAVLKALYKNYPSSRTIIMRNISDVLHTYNNNTGDVATSPLQQTGDTPAAAVGFQVLEIIEFVVSYDTFLRQSKVEDTPPSQNHLQHAHNMITAMIVYFKYSKSTTNELFDFVSKILTIYIFNSSQEFYDQLLCLLLRSCPQHNATVVVGYMKLLTIVLSYYPHMIPAPCPPSGPLLVHRSYPTSPLVHKSLVKLLDQCNSDHFKVSTEAINIVTSEVILCKYMLVDYPAEPSKFYLKMLFAKLVSNKKHWNIIVRELSDTKYDMLLDYY